MSCHRSYIVRVATAAAALALGISACGSEEEFPPPAEPVAAPVPASEPAGEVIELGRGEAEGIAVDPASGTVAVATRDPDRLYLIADPAGEARVREVEIPESPRHIQTTADGGGFLLTAERTDDLVEVALPGGETTLTKVGDFPHDAAEAANGRIFVGDEGGDTISVVEDGAVRVALPAPEQPGGVAAVGDQVGVIAVAERVLATYDTESLEKTGQLDAGVGPTHLVAGDDGRIYVADTQGDAVLVFEAEPELRLLDRVGVTDSPYGIAIDNDGGRLWVTRTGANLVTEYELGELAPRRLRSFDTVQQSNTVAVDPASGLVYVAGRTEGVLQVIDPTRDEEAG